MGYIEALVNEFKQEEFIDMDTNYFDKQGIREKAISVNERDLYGLYYDYDSVFVLITVQEKDTSNQERSWANDFCLIYCVNYL